MRFQNDVQRLRPWHLFQAQRDCAGHAVRHHQIQAREICHHLQQRTDVNVLKIQRHQAAPILAHLLRRRLPGGRRLLRRHRPTSPQQAHRQIQHTGAVCGHPNRCRVHGVFSSRFIKRVCTTLLAPGTELCSYNISRDALISATCASSRPSTSPTRTR